jgi:hypothetical protein
MLLTHQRRDGYSRSPSIPQIGCDPWWTISSSPNNFGSQPLAAMHCFGNGPAAVLEAGPGHPQRPADHDVRDLVFIPVGLRLESCRYRPVRPPPREPRCA